MEEDSYEDNTPFFVFGAPRSGTTLLRDILKSHDRLVAPEETFYFRWPFPFGTREFKDTYLNNPTITKHREIDGLSHEDFVDALMNSASRKELMDFHGDFMVQRTGKSRWFDKTPQNVYGAFLMASYYPNSTFVCIWRNPLNVAASLIEGRQIKVDTIEGAINYWMEAALIMLEFEKLHVDRVISLRYEDLTGAPQKTAEELLGKLGENPVRCCFDWSTVHPEQNLYESSLTGRQIAKVQASTADIRIEKGY